MPKRENGLYWAIGAALVLIMTGLIALVYWDAQRWEAYREAHHCAEAGETRQIIIQQCNMIGKVMVCTPTMITQHQWRCDEGEILWR
jgi:hypothetical protein